MRALLIVSVRRAFRPGAGAHRVGQVTVSNPSPTRERDRRRVDRLAAGWRGVDLAVGNASSLATAADAAGAIHAEVLDTRSTSTASFDVLTVTGSRGDGRAATDRHGPDRGRHRAPAGTDATVGRDLPGARGRDRVAARERAERTASSRAPVRPAARLAERRPARAAQQAALPVVAHFERVVHPGARALHVRGKLAGEQRGQPLGEVDALPQHDFAAARRAERGLEDAEQREQRSFGALFETRRVVRARLVEVRGRARLRAATRCLPCRAPRRARGRRSERS